jgi:nickel-dependent lactate racemase
MRSTENGPQVELDREALERFLEQLTQEWILAPAIQRLLILPPDHTRLQSRAGEITAWFWNRLAGKVHVDIMPALGTHAPMSREECTILFGPDVPYERILVHRWRQDLVRLGEITAEEIEDVSAGRFAEPMTVEVNHRLVNEQYDLVLSVGQVVPHEIIGFANYTKNVCIGAGGKDVIHKSHFLGAICGMESIMGQVDTPVRQIIDRAYEQFVRPLCEVGFVLTVVEQSSAGTTLRGLFAGFERDCFECAATLSSQVNVTIVDEPIQRCVVTLDPDEFKSTWLGNKAIYRTRMAMADGGELFVLAPGVKRFGEDVEIDALIRRHGYRGTKETLRALESDPALRQNLSAAAHLIHGSSERRFRITYCPAAGLSKSDVEQVGFDYRPLGDVARLFAPESRTEGWHDDAHGERFYLIRNPGLGLWKA